MYVDVDQLPDSARVWIFPCRAPLSSAQAATLKQKLVSFLENWCAHEQPLRAALWVDPYQVVLFVDTEKVAPSGCALDGWHKALSTCAKDLGIDCFYYQQILCQEAGQLKIYSPEEALRRWQRGDLSENTPIADVQVKTKAAFFAKTRFLPLGKSWLAAQQP